jgi:ATP-binding cassette subfamily B protein
MNRLALESINLSVLKGQKIGVVGKTGGGKSTLLDLGMGLLNPSSGQILIDGVPINHLNAVQWQKKIAHVSQSVYLTDASVAENIAFGVPLEKIDYKKVLKAAKKASIDDVIEDLPMKLNTIVGERGVRLSGGQRQRIAIARALYKEAEVLVFDEATSALDTVVENEVMQSINSLSKDLTIFIISHRISALENCDLIIEIESGKIISIMTFDQYRDNFI